MKMSRKIIKPAKPSHSTEEDAVRKKLNEALKVQKTLSEIAVHAALENCLQSLKSKSKL